MPEPKKPTALDVRRLAEEVTIDNSYVNFDKEHNDNGYYAKKNLEQDEKKAQAARAELTQLIKKHPELAEQAIHQLLNHTDEKRQDNGERVDTGTKATGYNLTAAIAEIRKDLRAAQASPASHVSSHEQPHASTTSVAHHNSPSHSKI